MKDTESTDEVVAKMYGNEIAADFRARVGHSGNAPLGESLHVLAHVLVERQEPPAGPQPFTSETIHGVFDKNAPRLI